jgi:CyaY protein
VVIINRHAVNREIWVAARAGGFHFRLQDGVWVDTRDGAELLQKLAALLTQQSGEVVRLT